MIKTRVVCYVVCYSLSHGPWPCILCSPSGCFSPAGKTGSSCGNRRFLIQIWSHQQKHARIHLSPGCERLEIPQGNKMLLQQQLTNNPSHNCSKSLDRFPSTHTDLMTLSIICWCLSGFFSPRGSLSVVEMEPDQVQLTLKLPQVRAGLPFAHQVPVSALRRNHI